MSVAAVVKNVEVLERADVLLPRSPALHMRNDSNIMPVTIDIATYLKSTRRALDGML